MKILYCAYHLDPHDPDSGSSADYNFFHAIHENGHDVRVLGPVKVKPILIERIVKKVYEKLTRKKYLKYFISDILRYRQFLNKEIHKWSPDLLFSIFPVPFVFYNGKIPCVFRMDAPMLGVEKDYVNYGSLAKRIFIWMEKRVFRKVRLIITHSDWSKNVLVNGYDVDPQKIFMFPNPCGIKKAIAVSEIQLQNKKVVFPLKLLAVGRDYHGKGIDIAINTVELLNEKGYPAILSICGMSGNADSDNVQYQGRYQKKRADEYATYLSHFLDAHFFIHPTRFDASPIVTSEASAFGLPVITNQVGGVGTSVLDMETGIILPFKSSANQYAEAVINLYLNPELYSRLSLNALKRFQTELNWENASKTLNMILEKAIQNL